MHREIIINSLYHPLINQTYSFDPINLTFESFFQTQSSLQSVLKYNSAVYASIPLSTKIRISRTVFHAIKFLHSHEIIHRDIKPDNIFINENFDATLGDYGYSRYLNFGADSTVCGTVIFLSYEMIKKVSETDSNITITKKSDVHSLNSTNMFMFQGTMPYHYIKEPHDKLKKKVLRGAHPYEESAYRFSRALTQAFKNGYEQNKYKDMNEYNSFYLELVKEADGICRAILSGDVKSFQKFYSDSVPKTEFSMSRVLENAARTINFFLEKRGKSVDDWSAQLNTLFNRNVIAQNVIVELQFIISSAEAYFINKYETEPGINHLEKYFDGYFTKVLTDYDHYIDSLWVDSQQFFDTFLYKKRCNSYGMYERATDELFFFKEKTYQTIKTDISRGNSDYSKIMKSTVAKEIIDCDVFDSPVKRASLKGKNVLQNTLSQIAQLSFFNEQLYSYDRISKNNFFCIFYYIKDGLYTAGLYQVRERVTGLCQVKEEVVEFYKKNTELCKKNPEDYSMFNRKFRIASAFMYGYGTTLQKAIKDFNRVIAKYGISDINDIDSIDVTSAMNHRMKENLRDVYLREVCPVDLTAVNGRKVVTVIKKGTVLDAVGLIKMDSFEPIELFWDDEKIAVIKGSKGIFCQIWLEFDCTLSVFFVSPFEIQQHESSITKKENEYKFKSFQSRMTKGTDGIPIYTIETKATVINHFPPN